MARKQRAQPQQAPAAGRRRGRFNDRFRPRKYTRINVETIDYKDLATLRRFMSDRGKVRSRRVTGLSRRHQQQLALAIRRARELALLPYVGER
jgi:small subunit ribosomal protein S18